MIKFNELSGDAVFLSPDRSFHIRLREASLPSWVTQNGQRWDVSRETAVALDKLLNEKYVVWDLTKDEKKKEEQSSATCPNPFQISILRNVYTDDYRCSFYFKEGEINKHLSINLTREDLVSLNREILKAFNII